jgi:hypothetical protein
MAHLSSQSVTWEATSLLGSAVTNPAAGTHHPLAGAYPLRRLAHVIESWARCPP